MALTSCIPAVYFWMDTDKSVQYLMETLEETQANTLSALAKLPVLTKQAVSTQLVEEWLEEVGNPFLLDTVSEETRRQLVLNITKFYAQRGTLVGLVDAITLFFNEIPKVTMDYQRAWTLGVSALGRDTKVLKYTASSLKVTMSNGLDTDRMRLLTTIVEFFKPLHMDWAFELDQPK